MRTRNRRGHPGSLVEGAPSWALEPIRLVGVGLAAARLKRATAARHLVRAVLFAAGGLLVACSSGEGDIGSATTPDISSEAPATLYDWQSEGNEVSVVEVVLGREEDSRRVSVAVPASTERVERDPDRPGDPYRFETPAGDPDRLVVEIEGGDYRDFGLPTRLRGGEPPFALDERRLDTDDYLDATVFTDPGGTEVLELVRDVRTGDSGLVRCRAELVPGAGFGDGETRRTMAEAVADICQTMTLV